MGVIPESKLKLDKLITRLMIYNTYFQLESGESRSGSSMSLSKPVPAIPSGRQSADLGIGHTGTALTPSGYAPGKPFPARYTPTMGNTSKSGEILLQISVANFMEHLLKNFNFCVVSWAFKYPWVVVKICTNKVSTFTW
jgi:hypothetical protein